MKKNVKEVTIYESGLHIFWELRNCRLRSVIQLYAKNQRFSNIAPDYRNYQGSLIKYVSGQIWARERRKSRYVFLTPISSKLCREILITCLVCFWHAFKLREPIKYAFPHKGSHNYRTKQKIEIPRHRFFRERVSRRHSGIYCIKSKGINSNTTLRYPNQIQMKRTKVFKHSWQRKIFVVIKVKSTVLSNNFA